MSNFKYEREIYPRKLPDAVAVNTDTDDSVGEATGLPVNTYDDYKSWCEKVRQEWDVN